MDKKKVLTYVRPEICLVDIVEEKDVLVKVSGGDIENPGEEDDEWDW